MAHLKTLVEECVGLSNKADHWESTVEVCQRAKCCLTSGIMGGNVSREKYGATDCYHLCCQ